MPSVPYHPSISAARAGALFASPLQRSDEPSARQVRRAIATAIDVHLTCARPRLERGTYCLGGIFEVSPDGAGCGLTCRLAVLIVAGCGLA